jgi:hypothetical protein
MKPFRQNVALAIDGGGIRGVLCTQALSMLEDYLGKPVKDTFRLAAGTSTGSIISAALGAGLTAKQMHELYISLGDIIFPKTLRSKLWLLLKYRYPHGPLEEALRKHVGDLKMRDFWATEPRTDVVITAFDLVANRTRFIKPWKEEYQDWSVIKAVLASSSVPTYFPAVDDLVDGGVGSYGNPAFLAAYEATTVLGWAPEETTLISLGTGHAEGGLKPGAANRLWPWQWLNPVLGAFLASADDQQFGLVGRLFPQIDFRRFQVPLASDIGMDQPEQMPQLLEYGKELGRRLLNDEWETPSDFRGARNP